MPLLSVIVAVHNGAAFLDAALTAIAQSEFRDFELIVVDDASTDDSGEIARRHAPAALAVNPVRLDAEASRNRGVALARGAILLFVDADVVVQRDTLGRAARHFEDPGVGAVIGVYELQRRHLNLASLYKNTWIRFTYLAASERPAWFFTAIGAVRRSHFDAVGGFDSGHTTASGGSDVEFGWRLARHGVVTLLDKGLEVKHLKTFTLASLLGNDMRRARGWSIMTLRTGRSLSHQARRGIANVTPAFCLAVAFAWGLVLGAPLAFAGGFGTVMAGGLALAYIGLSLPFLAYAARQLGAARALAFTPLLFLDQLACGLGVLRSVLGGARSGAPRIAASACPPETDQA